MAIRLTIREVRFVDHEAAIHAVRFEVFVAEQGVPPEMEMDERDPECVQLLAYLGDEPVATARIDIESRGKVGRLAVRAKARGKGIGRALMNRCHAIAARHGLTEVWCNAQVSAVPFYLRLGYAVDGGEFLEAGIPHRKMFRRLSRRASADTIRRQDSPD